MESGREESIRKIVESAEQERNRMIQYIESLIKNKLPETKDDITRVSEIFKDLARKMNIGFQSEEDEEGIIIKYIDNLNSLKQELENLEINDETLMQPSVNSVLEKGQKITSLIEPSIVELKKKSDTSNKSNLLKSYEQRESIKSEITDLKMKMNYLQGQLDATIIKKKKIEIEQKIVNLYDKIESLEDKLLEFEFHEEYAPYKPNSELIDVRQKSVEVQGIESIKKESKRSDDDSR